MKMRKSSKRTNLRPGGGAFLTTGQRQTNSIDFVKENFYEVY